jgi:hypothetical protein
MPIVISPFVFVWLGGMCAFALFFITAYIKCRREFLTSLPVENDFIDSWLREHPMLRTVQIRQSDRIKAPLTYGVFRPVILLPKKTGWTDETRLGYILTHEFVHIRRFDSLSKLLFAAAVCVHWFNPFVWVMHILANRDIELSCDETVVQTFGETMKSDYALTLIAMEEKKKGFKPLCNNFSKNAIEERIISIMKMKKISLAGIMLAMALVVGTTTIFATNAVSESDKEQERDVAMSEEAVYVETPENKAKQFTVYEQYGVTYNKATDQLLFKGELVRYFEDYYPIGEEGRAGLDYFNEKGTIDIHGVRDLTQLRENPDGSTDPSGKLLGVEPYSQDEFKARKTDELKNPPQTYAVSMDESTGKSQTSAAQELLSQEGTSPVTASSESMMTPDEMAKEYAIYKPFGLTYDKKQDCFYYKGKLVRYFIDILSSNGESLTSGKFQGSIRQMDKSDGKGEVDVYAVRDYSKPDANGNGILTDIKAYSKQEFDSRTKDQY